MQILSYICLRNPPFDEKNKVAKNTFGYPSGFQQLPVREISIY